jgi:hypothetical protein
VSPEEKNLRLNLRAARLVRAVESCADKPDRQPRKRGSKATARFINALASQAVRNETDPISFPDTFNANAAEKDLRNGLKAFNTACHNAGKTVPPTLWSPVARIFLLQLTMKSDAVDKHKKQRVSVSAGQELTL